MLTPPKQLSPLGLKSLQDVETCSLKAYPDPRGQTVRYSIGWGHSGANAGDVCTQAQADQWLSEDAGAAEGDINRLVNVPLTQGQFDALVSFRYNVGDHAFKTSTMLVLLNQGHYDAAYREFPRWVHANGEVDNELVERRKIEQATWTRAELPQAS